MKTQACLLATVLLWPATAAQAARELPSPYPYPEPAWSPYVVGVLIGILVLSTLALAGQKIGASSAYSDSAGMIGRLIAPQHIATLPYYQKSKPMIGWPAVARADMGSVARFSLQSVRGSP